MIEVGDRDGAEKAFQRCISVTPEMAKQVMKVRTESLSHLTAKR